MWSLRTRLLASYLLLLGVTLSIIVVALWLFLLTQPAPVQPTYQELSAVVRGADLRDVVIETALTQRPRLRGNDNQNALPFDTEVLAEFAESRGVRVLVIEPNRNIALYDSAGVFAQNAPIRLRRDTYSVPQRLLSSFPVRTEVLFGGLLDPSDDAEWLFIGLFWERALGGNQRTPDLMFTVAQPRPQQSLQAVLLQFREGVVLPLIQSAIVGLVVAFVLAAVISRTIARPLQRLVEATTAVAGGDYDQQVPVTGPPEFRTMAESFNYMSAQVRDTHQSQQDFLANVSHDLKTPLTSISGYSQAIMDGTAPDAAKAAGTIHDEAQRLTRLVTELTDLARLQAGRLTMAHDPIDVAAIATAAAERLLVVAHERNIEMHIDTRHTPPVLGDGDRIVQVCTNLISNAIKYTPKGGTVLVQTQANDSGVFLRVKDTGIGIAPEDLPRVFERFYQVDKSRGPRRGTGLGLSIVHEIVTAHGGRVNVTSEGIGKGSTFTVWLPKEAKSDATTLVRRMGDEVVVS